MCSTASQSGTASSTKPEKAGSPFKLNRKNGRSFEEFINGGVKQVLNPEFLGNRYVSNTIEITPEFMLSIPELEIPMLKMLTDWSWIRRRIDGVELISEGQTRRKVNCDIVLPTDFHVAYIPEEFPNQPSRTNPGLRFSGSTTQCASDAGEVVPVAFLRKGMLVKFDTSNEAGESLPSLSSGENAHLTFHPIFKLMSKCGLAETCAALFTENRLEEAGSSLEAFAHTDAEKTRSIVEAMRAGDWDSILRSALLDLIFSRRLDSSVRKGKIRRALQDVNRHDLFVNAAQYAGASRETQFDAHVDSLRTHVWRLGLNVDEDKGISEDQFDWVIDSSAAVQILVLALYQKIGELRKEVRSDSASVSSTTGDKYSPAQRKLMLLESLSLLLAVVSISYLSAVYRPTDEVRNESGPLRQLVKIACDAEVRDVDQGRVEEEEPEWHTWPHDLLRRRTKKKENGSNNVSLWKRFRHFVGVFFEDEMPAVEIRTPALGAKSSHVEFTPPEETSVTHVFAGIDNKLTEAGGIVEIMDQDYGKTILTFNDTQGKKASATTAGCDRETVIARMSDADETATEEKSAQFKRPLGIGESKYRVSQTSAHIQISPDRAFETLLVRLIPNNIRTLKAAHLATWLSILTTLLLLIRQGVEAPKANDAKFDPWLTFEGLITLLALLVAIFTALAFSAGQHLVARKIWAPTLNLFRSYLIIATLTPLVLIPGLIRPDFAYQSFLKYKVWLFHMPVYTLVALMLIAVGTLFLEASYRNYLNLHQHTEQNFYGEFVVQDSFDKRFRRRPEQNVVNPTETGPYDCRYLNFEYLSLGGPPLTARKYVSALSGNIRDTFEPKGQ